jgi:3-methyl-2-oxobutanoate hydroxymethyltransferase
MQGKESAAAQQLLQDAVVLEQAGANMIVLEAVPALLAAEITLQLIIPTIGIGAGAACSGQVLVLHDMLDIYPGKKARFVKNYMQGAASVADAVARYVREVKAGEFPGTEHTF